MRRWKLRAWMAATLLAISAEGCGEIRHARQSTDPGIRHFDDLYSVAVIDSDRVIAVGDYGSIYRSENGGRHWLRVDSPTTRSLYSISMADASNGWAVGLRGTILRTRDGGRSWTLQRGVEPQRAHHLLGVHAVDAESAWAVGVWGTRIATRDGGSTWSDHSVPVTLDDARFEWLSSEDQESVRAGGVVYEDVVLNDVYCLPPPSARCWIVGEFGTVFRSENLGESWARVRIEVREPSDSNAGFEAIESPNLFDVRFRNERDGLIAGLGGVILRSRDGGIRWSHAVVAPRRAVYAIESAADRCVAVGEKGLLRVSTDRGETWAAPAAGEVPELFSFLRDLDFDAAGEVGYTVGRGGTILRSDDAGRHWRSVAPLSDSIWGSLPTPAAHLKRAIASADFTGRGRAR